VTPLLTGEAFWELFLSFRHTAFRLETRDRYVVPEERKPFDRFLAGQPADDSWIADFCGTVGGWVAEGKRMERVRVVSQPHSDYVRWSLTVARLNVGAGEDIRYLPRQRAERLGLPDEDYWLFDSRRVAALRFDSADRLLGAELIEDPAAVVRRCYWRDAAWHYAIPWRRYVSS
jgi:hypothetical protein